MKTERFLVRVALMTGCSAMGHVTHGWTHDLWVALSIFWLAAAFVDWIIGSAKARP